MAKTIKFNLMIDEQPVRDIKGLQENFCIDDILDLYQNRLLQKWLDVRGFDEYLKKVEAIKEDESTIVQLIEIFDIKKTEKDIKEDIYSLEFWEERKIELAEWHKKDLEIKNIIADYHNGYDVLMIKIQENRDDMPFLKAATKEIFDKYLDIFKIDYPFFFEKFNENNPLIIYAILMNKSLRNIFLKDEVIKSALILMNNRFIAGWDSLNNISSDIGSSDEGINGYGIDLINNESLTKISTFKGETSGYWKDLEVSGTEVMILSAPDGTFIRNADKPKEEISVKEAQGYFLILNGLLYKSNENNKSIIYMEV